MSNECAVNLPDYVMLCPLCGGRGAYKQRYTAGCGGGYFTSLGPCSMCSQGDAYEGSGYVYKGTCEPVGKSVLAQINTSHFGTMKERKSHG